ncbi:MAG TPA: hypothetical protein VGS61_04145 [Acidimicrobiales bacterium]|nr:hypothetical protein [Acidimicrobiales bacterium]
MRIWTARLTGALALATASAGVWLGTVGNNPSIAAGSPVNTFTLSGKYHGTLKIPNPTKDCFIEEFSTPGLFDTIRFDYMTGAISGQTTKSWYFVATEPHQGTFVTKVSSHTNTARLRPENNSVTIQFTQTSGTIVFSGKTGSVNMRVVYNNGYANTVTETLSGSWSCPKVTKL